MGADSAFLLCLLQKRKLLNVRQIVFRCGMIGFFHHVSNGFLMVDLFSRLCLRIFISSVFF